MTINKAKQLLGQKYKNLSDSEIQTKIASLGEFAESLVDAVLQNIDILNTNETSNNSS